ncbi:transcription factor IIIB 90 kDa subunit-like isoform X1 [Neltuma alba]|uniref:transcription factor IIIB 90 kDa subunit-like isoform X1 n=1 Tax=Neltuma alba TaxID=207710 RepID=UPI0010A48A65|nr:transcription factor IIIB 90 kDa subunit-like isoform X1 [Prosopis alba]XP_028774489.1 transcription factor IIIB 90 kDa subunit-like isoform X1 [Prosopis alba]
MIYCDHCQKFVHGMRPDEASLCCEACGKVLEDMYFSQEPTFIKDASGQSKLSGNYVKTIQSGYSASRKRTLDRAFDDIRYLSQNLGVEDVRLSTQALTFYKIAMERNFTKGRKSEQVQAACLYIAFRAEDKPYLLIDFSNYLRTNVYVLGAVFLQLCKVLRLEEHPIVQKPVDPSLFIFKYTRNLLNQRNIIVTETALSIIASMKRDWMQTGRKPSGLCGAALYIAALAHGFKYSKSDILRIVHVCEATLTKRLVEFENTTSASLTVGELKMMAKEREKIPIEKPNCGSEEHVSKDLLCEHKDSGVPHWAHGLCERCYEDFVKLSGGLDGGLDPPAFQRAERDRMTKSPCEESGTQSSDLAKASNGMCAGRKEDLSAPGPESVVADVEEMATKDGGNDESNGEDMSAKTPSESESLSDIDDLEVEGYLHNEEEKHYKTLIWSEMNREYLEEQAAKEEAAAAAKEAFEANFHCSEDMLAAKELAESAAAAVAKSRKEKKQRRAQEAKNSGPAQSAAEATRKMLINKRLSSKVNLDRLDNLFDDIEASVNKKVRFELHSHKGGKLEPEPEDKDKGDDMGSVDKFEYGGYMGKENNLQEEKLAEYDCGDDDYSYDDDD